MQELTTGSIIRPSKRYQARKARASVKVRAHTLNLKRMRELASIGMPIQSIAKRMGICPKWLDEQKRKNFDIEEALLLGSMEFEESLRSVQARLALSGDRGMLIWLGKQFLGQSDKQETKTETTVNLTLQQAMQEMRALGKEEVLAIRGIIDGNATDAEYVETPGKP